MAPLIHERVQCPRCGARGARELSRLPEEGHGVLMCPFCKHTWCEQGRQQPHPAAIRVPSAQSPRRTPERPGSKGVP